MTPILTVLALGIAALAIALSIASGGLRTSSLPYLAVASAVSMALALTLPLLASRVPQRAAVVRGLLPWATLFALLTLLVGTLTRTLGPEGPEWLGAAAGLAISLPLMVATIMLWILPLRAVYEAAEDLARPERRDHAIRTLHTITANACAGTGYADRRHARSFVVAAAAALVEARCFRDALEVISRLRQPDLPRITLLPLHQTRAVAHLYLGEHAEAERAILAAFALSPPAIMMPVLLTQQALVLAVSGRIEEANAALSRVAEPTQTRQRRGWLLAKANVTAGLGDVAGARQALETLAGENPDGLERAIALGGSAADLARDAALTRG